MGTRLLLSGLVKPVIQFVNREILIRAIRLRAHFTGLPGCHVLAHLPGDLRILFLLSHNLIFAPKLRTANVQNKVLLVYCLLFKWIKQHLKIKSFWGTTENAVKTQVYIAVITYTLVAIIRQRLKTEYTTYEVLQILCSS